MTSSHESSEYLISVIPDTTGSSTILNTTGGTMLMLVDIAHSRDISTNEKFTTYLFYSYKVNHTDSNATFTVENVSGTVYIYYISI